MHDPGAGVRSGRQTCTHERNPLGPRPSTHGVIREYNKETGKSVAEFRGDNASPTSLAFSPDGKICAIGALDATVLLSGLGAVKQ